MFSLALILLPYSFIFPNILIVCKKNYNGAILIQPLILLPCLNLNISMKNKMIIYTENIYAS